MLLYLTYFKKEITMAKKEKVQLISEEAAAKSLKKRKGWARFFAVVLALAVTAGVYAIGSKGGNKVETASNTTVAATTTKATTTAKAAETTTAAATTTTTAKATTTATTAATTKSSTSTTKASSSSSSSSVLDKIKSGISGLIGGSGSLPSVDTGAIGDGVEKAGAAAKDFFYGIADKVETTTTVTTTTAH